jgi:hypothetical protein
MTPHLLFSSVAAIVSPGRHRVAGLWVAAAVGLMPVVSDAQNQPASVNLQPDWEAGQTARYRFNQTRERTQSLQAGDRQRQQTTTTQITGEAIWRVQSIRPGGGAQCRLRYDWARMVLTGPKGQQKINDSREASGDVEPIHNLLNAMTEHALTVTVASDGTIAEVTGGDAIRGALDNASMAPSQRDLRRTAAKMAAIPAGPASVTTGRTWNHRFTESHPLGVMRFDAEYELAGLETIASIPIATITVTAEMQLEPKQRNRPANAPAVDTRLLESNYRSQVMFDLMRREAVGRFTRQLQVVEQTMSMQGRTLTQRMTEKVESDLLRIDETAP